MSKFSSLLILFFFPAWICTAQVMKWQGVVRDAETKETLPFVNVLTADQTAVATSGIDGKFSIAARPGSVLHFSYVGYEGRQITLGDSNGNFLAVELKISAQQLSTVEVYAGENPGF